uniref:General transcription factor IIH subunit 4 n=1 Tax=Skeletonema marinoi TaxID=267567 RepID=A0A7S1VYL6_9STRA|mmetsp:Transcript_862/g.1389  ORF Transcript_862/g.1389 Transcript_862/m.1389 type:complete len:600 (+) Transcript_862:43-1842(+)
MPAPSKRKRAGDASSTASKVGRSSADSSASSAANTATQAASELTKIDPQEELLSTSKSLFEYLERLPPGTLRSIYNLPPPGGATVAAAVLRSSSLTDIARQCALRLVACGGKFKVGSIVEKWIQRHGQRDALLALRRLESMGILEPLGLANRPGQGNDDIDDEANDSEKRAKLMAKIACLTPEFKGAMKLHLSTMSSSPWPTISREQIEEFKKSGVGAKSDGGEKESRDPPAPYELELYTQSSWDSVLHFLVGSDEAGKDKGGVEEPPEVMIQFLTRIGLMQEDPDYNGADRSRAPLVITSKGYEFMLRDTNAQVWQFVLQYLNSLAHHNMKDAIRMEALSFLICLGSCRVGEGYFNSVLQSKSARILMKDLARFGLLFVCRVAGKKAFYPTRVAVNLVASNEKEGSRQTDAIGQSVAATRSLEESLSAPVPSRSHLAVVVQTNFQVVAYTTSKLHISTLALFCDVESYRRLPNVIFFHITRDSIRSAFRLGVKADQILRFLHVHAHPMLRNGDHQLVPSNVTDQILLWDRERRRVVMDEVWAHQCRDSSEFAAVGQYASDLDALAWGNAHTNKLYVHFGKSEMVYAYIRKWRTKHYNS